MMLIATPDSLRDDITAKELARLQFLSITYTDAGLAAMTPEDRALVERNSRPLVLAIEGSASA
jgi:hypothetical protein